MLKTIIAAILVIVLSGCRLLPSKEHDSIYVTNSTRVYNEKETARVLLTNTDGLKYKTDRKFSFRTIKGTKKLNGYWAWRPDPTNKPDFWVCGYIGYAQKMDITLVSNPNNSEDYNSDFSIHEFGHFWRYACYDDVYHDDKYSKIFLNWASYYNVKTLNSISEDQYHYEQILEEDAK